MSFDKGGTPEYVASWVLAAKVSAIPAFILDGAAAANESVAGERNPAREADYWVFQNLLDHTGNMAESWMLNSVVLGGGMILSFYNDKDSEFKKVVIRSSALATGSVMLSNTMAEAYSQVAEVRPFSDEPLGDFDAQDIAYGTGAALLETAIFCTTALYMKTKNLFD